MFEVTEEQYREFYRHKRKEKYLEEQVVDNILLDSMLRCVSELPEEDLRLIHALYYQRKSACEYAEEIGLCQKTVNNLKEWVLKKMICTPKVRHFWGAYQLARG